MKVFNFRKGKFKMFIDFRLLSTHGPDSGYNEPIFSGDPPSSIEMDAIRHYSYDSKSTSRAFAANVIDADDMAHAGDWLDLSTQPPGNVWLFKHEERDNYRVDRVHSSRKEKAAAVESAPTFSGDPWSDDGHYNTYGNGGYVYVDKRGKLHFKFVISPTQYGYYCTPRPTFLFGIEQE